MLKSELRSRRSGSGFSLDEAARIRLAVLETGAPPPCPRCGEPLRETGGALGGNQVWMLHCQGCGAGIVIQAPAAHSTG